MTRRFDAGPLIAGAGALVLLVSLFLEWFEPEITAWTVFEALDLVLATVAVAALVAAAAGSRGDLPAASRLLAVVGGTAFVVVASQLLGHPPAAVSADASTGAWLALAGAALMLVGGTLSVARVSLAVSFAPRSAVGGNGGGAGAVTLRDVPNVPAAAAAPPSGTAAERASQTGAAAAREPESAVLDELYPEPKRRGPIGADDPEPWTTPVEAPASTRKLESVEEPPPEGSKPRHKPSRKVDG